MRSLSIAIISSLALSLTACGATNANRSLYSVNQPVVERSEYVLDLAPEFNGGLSVSEYNRLSGWLDAINLRYGDRIAMDNPSGLSAGGVRAAVLGEATNRGIELADLAPVTTGNVPANAIRIVVSRSSASVPNCPNWSHRSITDFQSRTSANYGCGVNSTMAAMIADPEDFVKGDAAAKTDPYSIRSKKGNQ
jgi:pilus assembly protein CpaD